LFEKIKGEFRNFRTENRENNEQSSTEITESGSLWGNWRGIVELKGEGSGDKRKGKF